LRYRPAVQPGITPALVIAFAATAKLVALTFVVEAQAHVQREGVGLISKTGAELLKAVGER
jgi:hypothetical protein